MDQELKTVVFISYNQVNGLTSGWHGDGRVFVHANDDGAWGSATGSGGNDYERAISVMRSLKHDFYRNLKVPVKDVDRFFIYAGLNAFQDAISLAMELKQLSEADVAVVACSCDWSEKQRLLEGMGIELIGCDCGGQEKMGALARRALATDQLVA